MDTCWDDRSINRNENYFDIPVLMMVTETETLTSTLHHNIFTYLDYVFFCYLHTVGFYPYLLSYIYIYIYIYSFHFLLLISVNLNCFFPQFSLTNSSFSRQFCRVFLCSLWTDFLTGFLSLTFSYFSFFFFFFTLFLWNHKWSLIFLIFARSGRRDYFRFSPRIISHLYSQPFFPPLLCLPKSVITHLNLVQLHLTSVLKKSPILFIRFL